MATYRAVSYAMDKAPKVGDRVRYVELDNAYGTREAVEGRVISVYPKELAPAADHDWNDPKSPPFIGTAPEKEWGTCVEVDALPKWWPYGPDIKRFFPLVSELTPCG